MRIAIVVTIVFVIALGTVVRLAAIVLTIVRIVLVIMVIGLSV